MCATRMARDILIVTTAKRRYGITPADEGALVAALMPRLPKRRVATPDADATPGLGD
jgi:hypothetical protein